MSAPMPLVAARHDLPAYADALLEAATATGLPYELLVAQSLQESSWKLHAYRYEPNYDRRYISSPKGAARWHTTAAWLAAGPSCADWFAAHPARAGERTAGVDYGFVAQTRIAASYGPFQLMFPTAIDVGYAGPPEGLYDPANIRIGPKLLAAHVRIAKAAGWSDRDAYMIALARYNGGAKGNDVPTALRNIDYVRLIDRRYRECWGHTFLFN